MAIGEKCEQCGVETDHRTAATSPIVAYTNGLERNRHVYCWKCWSQPIAQPAK